DANCDDKLEKLEKKILELENLILKQLESQK
ncbi:serine O-acetyltransferase, partial [Campylobacter jejuni]|nr:serine O-acetyltransferase [Campylobacter jejuni]